MQPRGTDVVAAPVTGAERRLVNSRILPVHLLVVVVVVGGGGITLTTTSVDAVLVGNPEGQAEPPSRHFCGLLFGLSQIGFFDQQS